MDIFIGLLSLTGLAAACLVALVLFQDTWAIKFAAILKARVEARIAYRDKYRLALRRLENEFGINPTNAI